MRYSYASCARLAAALLLLPLSSHAQNAPGQQRARPDRVGRMQRENCAADTTRSVQRAVGTDSVRGGGGGGGAQNITGGTARSHEFPEFDVVLDIPNVCVQRIFLKVDSVTAKLNLDAKVANLLRVNAGA